MTHPRSGHHPLHLGRQLSQTCRSMGTAASKPLGVGGGQIGVQAPLARGESTSIAHSNRFPTSYGSIGFSGLGSRGLFLDNQGCRGSGSLPQFTGVLWSPFCRPQGLGRLETCPGPLVSEYFSGIQTLQNGDGVVYTRGRSAGGLGHIPGPTRRILPHPHSRDGSQISSLLMEGRSVPVQGLTFWPCPSSVAVHQGHKGALSSGEATGDQTACLPRRLAAPGANGSPLPGSLGVCSQSLFESGIHPERREVGSDSFPILPVPGNVFRHSEVDSLTLPSASGKTSGVSSGRLNLASGSCSYVGIPFGNDGVHGAPPAFGSASQEAISASFSAGVGETQQELVLPSSAGFSVQGGYPSMAEPRMALSRCPHLPPSGTGDSVHRCLATGLGCSHGESDGVWSMASTPVSGSHQLVRVRSSLAGLERVQKGSSGEACVVEHGQHHGCSVREQAGGAALLLTVDQGGGPAPVVPRVGDRSDCQVCSGEAKHTGRLSEPVSYDPSVGVDISPQNSRTSVGEVVQATHRSLRDKVQQKAASVCVPGSGPTGVGGGCSRDSMDKPVSVCLPSVLNSEKGDKKGKSRRSKSDSRGSDVGITTMVSRPSGSVPRRSGSVGNRSSRSNSAQIGSASRRSSSAKSARVVSVRESLQSRGASDDVIDFVDQAHRPGTKKIYRARWKAWCQYCARKDISPTSPSHIQLANYLAYLAKSKGLSASAVKGHRSAIATTLKQLGRRSFSEDPLLRDVIRGVSLNEARSPKHFPAWDVHPVLESLRLPPYEPIESCDLKSLSCKTAFLVALASGRRCSEIHALKNSSFAREPDGSISLRFIPEFIAKNQPAGLPSPPIFIKPLEPFLCDDDEDRTLCPVRALKTYKERTKFLRSPAKRRLFVSFRSSKMTDISCPTISRWIKTVIKAAVSKVGSSQGAKSCRAHEVRAWASSLAWANNTSLASIMEAAYWFSEATFLHFYLRDVSHVKEDGSRGLSLVAAQQVLVAPSSKRSKSSKQ